MHEWKPKIAPAERPGATSSSSAETLDPRVLSSVLVSVKMAQFEAPPVTGDTQARMLELMHSPEMRALLDSAQLLSVREGTEPHEGLTQIITTLQEIDKLWGQVLLKEGLARLNSSYH
ncbi:MAG: hypothetical protein EOP11_04325 [Proteobacteria bacterium]|nr:MAG: hypothetical protein EOP11_04325 [Pseudomonadota bacterium]